MHYTHLVQRTVEVVSSISHTIMHEQKSCFLIQIFTILDIMLVQAKTDLVRKILEHAFGREYMQLSYSFVLYFVWFHDL